MDAKEVLGRTGRSTLRFLLENPVTKMRGGIFVFGVIGANIVLFFEVAISSGNVI